MIRELRLNYIYADDQTWEKLALACDELGWNQSSIVKQCLHGFFRQDGRFYAEAGKVDAEARGMTEEAYFACLRDQTEEDLRPYRDGRPAFGAAPIDSIPLIPTDPTSRRAHHTIGLSAYNYVLLRVARVVDGGSMVQVVSRMLIKHFQDNWETSYLPQIERDRACRFL